MILPPNEGAIHSDAQVCILEIAGISMMLTMVFTKSAKRKILYVLLGQSKGTVAGFITKSEKLWFSPCHFGRVQTLLP
jgi:hypothetical protein